MNLGRQAKKTIAKYKARARAKISRLKKIGIDVKPFLDFDLNVEFENRKQYNAWKRSIDSFTSRTNVDFKVKKTSNNVPYLPVEQKELSRLTREANKRSKEKREQLMQLEQLDKHGNIVGTVADELSVLKDKETGFVKEVSELTVEDMPNRRVLNKRLDKMRERASNDYYDKRNETMRENYIKLMYQVYHDNADEIVKMINTLSSDDFVEFYLKNRDFQFAWYDSQKGLYIGGDTEHLLDDPVGELKNNLQNWIDNRADKDLSKFK